MSKLRIEVVVSTANAGLSRAGELSREILSAGVECTVIHQVYGPWRDSNTFEDISQSVPGVRHVVVQDRGLAKSRNLGLRLSCNELLIPTDDDVHFLPGAFEIIQDEFDSNLDVDLIAFQAVVPGGAPYKRYHRKKRFLDRFSIGTVSSIEIVVRRTSLIRSGVCWNEEFGLGSKYNGCLENAFLSRVVRAGLRVMYIPVPIVEHPEESSGAKCDLEAAKRRGAIFKETYGVLGLGVCVYNWVKYFGVYSRQAGAYTALAAMLREFIRYKSGGQS